MIATRLRQISLLLIAMAISALAFIQMFQRTAGEFPMQYAGMLALVVVLFLVLWGLIVRFQPYASQSILPCVLLLTATGVTMIARIDQSEGWAVAQRQLIWLCIAIVLSALLIIFLNIRNVPGMFASIFRNAFDFQSVMGGFSGSCIMYGVKRGLYSNEAGMGSAPNVAATAQVSHPVKQGLIQTLGVFTDTLIICTCTAFIILFSGAPLDGSVNGVQLTQQALTNEIGSIGSIFVAVAILLFAFSSIIGNYYYGEANIRFITRKRSILLIYRLLVGGMVMFGALASLDLAWSLADITMGTMTICNLIAISLLSRQAFLLLKDYVAQKRKGIKSPVFDKNSIPELKDKAECW